MGAKSKLTKKQQQFVNEYLIDLNATAAYKRAGYKGQGNTAEVNAHKLLRNSKVSEAIEEATKARAERTQIKADDVLKELAKIAFDDMKNYLEFRTEKQIVAYDEEEDEEGNFIRTPVIGYAQVIEMKDSQEIDTRNIQEISMSPKEGFKFKLYGKDTALINLAKHLGLFDPKHNHLEELVKVQIRQAQAAAELTEAKTKLIKGAAKDTSKLDALIGLMNE